MFGGGGSTSDKMAHTVLSEEPTWRATFARLGEREVLIAGTAGRLNYLPAFSSAPSVMTDDGAIISSACLQLQRGQGHDVHFQRTRGIPRASL
jgi:hypothetical protein